MLRHILDPRRLEFCGAVEQAVRCRFGRDLVRTEIDQLDREALEKTELVLLPAYSIKDCRLIPQGLNLASELRWFYRYRKGIVIYDVMPQRIVMEMSALAKDPTSTCYLRCPPTDSDWEAVSRLRPLTEEELRETCLAHCGSLPALARIIHDLRSSLIAQMSVAIVVSLLARVDALLQLHEKYSEQAMVRRFTSISIWQQQDYEDCLSLMNEISRAFWQTGTEHDLAAPISQPPSTFRHILFADDEGVSECLLDGLRELGYYCECCDDYVECEEKIGLGGFDVLFCDLSWIPGGRGERLLELAVRARDEWVYPTESNPFRAPWGLILAWTGDPSATVARVEYADAVIDKYKYYNNAALLHARLWQLSKEVRLDLTTAV